MYAPIINLYLNSNCSSERAKILANLVRGLLNYSEGFNSISGLSDDKFIRAAQNNKKIRLKFSNVKKAHNFKKNADQFLPDGIITRRVKYP
ncbi:hypothetical protein [Thiothrix winogradskyi]|uniref:Uncharacterized protein n=1 Tax=Thiothrix winogradskyi TaxID=96472 RepID=A0ABY3SW28_9GAMM|nr:hypothetical protein [Thiothrix winogradskyi]UJS23084.1 hypothetical protein L2Y54_14170 [Thiothrix winogradskyi]